MFWLACAGHRAMNTRTHSLIDKCGMVASTTCAVHCFAAPVLITVAPLIGLGFLFHESFENIIIMSSLGLASLSLLWGFSQKHRQVKPFYLLLLAIVFFALSRVDSLANIVSEPVLVGLGGMALVASHFINLKLCRTCHDCEVH